MFMMDCYSELIIVGERIDHGSLRVNLVPTDKTGVRNLSEDVDNDLIEEVGDPMELMGGRFDFNVFIESASIDEYPCHDVYVEYSLQ